MAQTKLESAIREHETGQRGADAEAEADEAEGEGVEPEDDTTAAEEKPSGGIGTGLGAVSQLLSLVRTDYTLTAANVMTSPSELATLSAAAVARHAGSSGASVEIDRFTAANDSECVTGLNRVATQRDDVAGKLADLETRLAPTEAELAALRARISALEVTWTTWVTAKDRSADGGDVIRREIDGLCQRVGGGSAKITRPAPIAADNSRAILSEVDLSLTTLIQPAQQPDSPILTAIRWERLNNRPATDGAINHVLYVNTEQVAADLVTRKSILGSSGQIAFLGTANVSWLLMDVANNMVRAGGAMNLAKRLRFDLETGDTEQGEVKPSGTLKKIRCDVWRRS